MGGEKVSSGCGESKVTRRKVEPDMLSSETVEMMRVWLTHRDGHLDGLMFVLHVHANIFVEVEVAPAREFDTLAIPVVNPVWGSIVHPAVEIRVSSLPAVRVRVDDDSKTFKPCFISVNGTRTWVLLGEPKRQTIGRLL
mmetsp:Transcript_17455/g.36241  ORF Transcript_17455/g.36241 Transcript_17455/m.36241 type:complete len:139 (+) Transcript_17455:3118-3534(+)